MTEALSPNLKVIGRYTVLRELRRDPHSVSYAAVDPVMNRELVVKAVLLLSPDAHVSDSERKQVEQAFVRQAQAAGRLHHPHILTVFDAGLSHDFGYLVIERVAGRPLHDILAHGVRPPFAQCASIAARIADAIDYAHGQGVAHGQLGPQHVFLLADGTPKISGFGGWIDAGATGDDALARTADRLPYFQSEPSAETLRADVRAVGVLLHMMLTGRAPRPPAPGAQATANGFAPVASMRPDIPLALARLVDASLDPKPPRAVATAGALRDALTSYIWNERSSAIAPATLGLPLSAPPGSIVSKKFTNEPPASSGGSATASTPASSAEVAAVEAAAAAAAIEPPAPPSLGRSIGDFVDRFIDQVVPVVQRHRFVLTAAALIILVAMGLGTLLAALGQREHRGPGPIVVPGSATPGLAPQAPTAGAPATAPGAAPAVVSGNGRLQFDIAPWGEIIIDGRPTGVAPPLSHVTLAAGRHTIEIRHGNQPAWIGDVDIDPARPLIIEHRFE
ncbi:MAG TPA: serine/threonine-protein kinase [Burkholderiaceae bacterium]|nr:serine/threonine-protein kinase [Burkholderiaceae bacterium]